ncbi:MAG TPA: hypothetical protein VFY92_07685 [Hyphomicrobiaceae bacterium]|nr:hypothetical protein [Hyphomicrobiaceae bacterium]
MWRESSQRGGDRELLSGLGREVAEIAWLMGMIGALSVAGVGLAVILAGV